MNKIEYAVMVGDGYVDIRHFHAGQDAYEYMNFVLANDPKLSGVRMKVVRRAVGEWEDDSDD